MDIDTGSIRCTPFRHPDVLKSMFSSFIDDLVSGNLQHPSMWKVTDEDPTHTESSDSARSSDEDEAKSPSMLQRIK